MAFFISFLGFVIFDASSCLVSSSGGFNWVSSFFLCDAVTLYLTVLSVFLLVSLSFFISQLKPISIIMISLSVVFSILSYWCAHAMLFWFFYEFSILCLLLLIIIESPYSERYIASWYLLGYVIVTSLPMLACIFYISLSYGTFNFYNWDSATPVHPLMFCLLSVLFITKIPLFPFHVWLPIVHAEATSVVSVCLSGFIMKLGLLGVYRFCYTVLPNSIFFGNYVLVLLGLTVVYFFCACRELDGKRWLAFLSLSHIVIPVVCLYSSLYDQAMLSFLYCLGHGMSAGVTFILLWVMYDVSGSRNWFLVKGCVSGSLFFRVCCGSSLCTVASLPPTIQFFSEVCVMQSSSVVSGLFSFFIFVYLFFGGLVPMFLLGGLLTRHYSINFGGGYVIGGLSSVAFLVFWSFSLFMLI